MAPVPDELEASQPLTHQGRQLNQPLKDSPHQGGCRQHDSSGHRGRWKRDLLTELPPEQSHTGDQGQAGHQRRDGGNPEFIGRIERPEPQTDQAGEKRHGRHHLELNRGDRVQLWTEPWTNKMDQWIRRDHQDHCDHQQQGADTGVQGRKNMSPLVPGPAAENADHGAVKRPVDAPEQDQQKSREHIGVVVCVIGSAHTERRSNHQLSQQTPEFAEQGAEGHHQSDPLE